MTDAETNKIVYLVTFRDRNSSGTWSATYSAESFAHAEEDALLTLQVNKDYASVIDKIERW